jgi:hypothetical protein
VFARGAAGAGKLLVLEEELRRRAATRPAPSDWVYLFDFATLERPARGGFHWVIGGVWHGLLLDVGRRGAGHLAERLAGDRRPVLLVAAIHGGYHLPPMKLS